ncbi:Pimeloyl-ACP methyl ester carboxylesterase [Halpernia humi]|uniref:Pimeloyl-ACP methyl ester carboxylesterase n=1 Tax=Halpernia humi TaxID=493375 RepID=A0A1H5YAI9_9FLAO|nr:alpha/beta hydrolase [Halpernia humi]SEG21109.1 Pimeloyl-ACP methyl ester carboxylesterase [Halpernia humi]
MKHLLLLLSAFLVIGCQKQNTKSVHEKTFVELGGEKQYVEMTGASTELPVLLFLHGGPGWPQTPHLRYFNSDLTKDMIVVSWDQAGCGQSYMRNPNPKKLSVESLISDAHELTQYLKKKFNKKKIVLLGFSYGSVIGLQLAKRYPDDYYAYIGVSQLINFQQSWDSSMQWIKEQAKSRKDTAALKQIKLLEDKDPSVCKTVQECFMNKYLLLVKYDGTIYKKEKADEIAKAESYYDDYKKYDWEKAYNYTSSRLGGKQFNTDLSNITSLSVPVYFMAGKHDWNLPGIVTEKYLNKLRAPQKEFIWFENSGHEPPEEEADKFNKDIIEIVKKVAKKG